MKKSYPYSKDSDFLYTVNSMRYTEEYAKITLLDWLENPIQEVEGLVTGGNLNINGSSSMRRTSNLTAILKDSTNLFTINRKIYLEIGYTNKTKKYKDYPIIWFPQGVYTIASASLSHSTSGTTVSLQIKDKMSLLNGDCGGTIPASTQFDSYETIDENGEIIISQPTIDQIIREVVNHFGGEQLGKIIISDIDKRIKTVLKWIGNTPIYLINDNGSYSITTDYSKASKYSYQMFSYGDNIGYMYSDFVYTDDLIGDAGTDVTDILDKIVSYLGGNYEYFYNVYGDFIFQEIKNYLNTSQAKVELENLKNEDYVVDMSKGKSVYNFKDNKIVISCSRTPQYTNIKNDYVVWGTRESAEGVTLPIRYHLAIDTKPKTGNIYKVFFYEDPDDGITKAKIPVSYSSYAEMVKTDGAQGVYYLDNSTGNVYIWSEGEYTQIDVIFDRVMANDWRSELYFQGVAAEPLGLESNYYYAELESEWPKIYNFKAKENTDAEGIYYTGEFYEEVVKDPQSIDYFLDFIDSDAAISQYSVSNIGRRSEVESSDDYNCVFESEIPDFVIIETGQEDTAEKRAECEARGQAYIQVDPNIFDSLATGSNYNSCYNEVKNLLYTKTGYNETIQITTLPIYHLEPNTRITVNDAESGISGDYIINTMSIPLTVNGNMSISAGKTAVKI